MKLIRRVALVVALFIGGVAFIQASGQAAPARARVSAGVMAGQILSKVNPTYPADAKAEHISGSVVLHAIISNSGTVEDLSVVSGPEKLRQASLDAVRQWRYKPYVLSGKPVEVETMVTVNFSLAK